jgi:uncharacterized protein (TIGR03083 family)
MQLTPRYDGSALFAIEGPVDDALAPLARQRRRLESVLATLDDDQWEVPSRCQGWRPREVVAHLNTVNAYYAASITAGLSGSPTKMLVNFDPVTSPPALIAGRADQAPAELIDQFAASNGALLDVVGALDEAGWATLAESPPGHVPVRYACFHALWDCWVHERDILLPLGLAPAVEADEVGVCLRYVASLSPAFAAVTGSAPPAPVFVLDAHDPDVSFVIEATDPVVVRSGDAPADAPRLRGGAVELIDALSLRSPLPAAAPEAWTHLVRDGLGVVFDGEGSPSAPS